MKTIALSTVVVLMMSGCTVKQNTYLSTANDPSKTVSIETDFTVEHIKDKSMGYPKNFGVIAAQDNNEFKYTLIAPTNTPIGKNPKLENFILYHAVPLNDMNLKELISKVSIAIDNWELKYPITKGNNVTYNIIGEQTEMTFTFQSGENGSLSSLQVSTGKKYVYENATNNNVYIKIYNWRFDKVKDLKGFKSLLEASLNETNFGYKEKEVPKAWYHTK